MGSGTGLMGITGSSSHPHKSVPSTHAAGAYKMQHSEGLHLNKQHSKADLKITV